MSNIKQILEEKVSEFNTRIKDEPKFSGVIEGKERSICISVTNEENYITNLKDMHLDPFTESDNTDKDLVVTASSDVLLALINKEMSPIKAYMTGELKIKASLTDMLLLKKLF
jgi:putative sterol carrier protein